MDKLTAIKIKYDDGTYSDEIPVSALSENVEWDSTHTLVDVLGSIDVNVTGTIQDQISRLFNEKVSITQLNNYVASQLSTDVANWLNNNVDPVGSAVIVDGSLTISGAAADAKVVGKLKSTYDHITTALNTHKVAQPLDEYNHPTDGTDGQLLRTKGDGTTEWADVGLPTDAQTAEAVSAWLDEHPEATTTVQDHSLTYEKLAIGTLGYVTPEMFGAVGNGVTDDATAVQNAIDSGNNVYFANKYYVGSTILLNKVTGVKLFGRSDYASGTNDFGIYSDASVVFRFIGCRNISIEKIHFIAKTNNTTVLKFDTTSTMFLTFKDLSISGRGATDGGIAVDAQRMYYCNFYNGNYWNIGTAFKCGENHKGSGSVNFFGVHVTSVATAFLLDSNSDFNLNGVTIENVGTALYVGGTNNRVSVSQSYIGDGMKQVAIVKDTATLKISDMPQILSAYGGNKDSVLLGTVTGFYVDDKATLLISNSTIADGMIANQPKTATITKANSGAIIMLNNVGVKGANIFIGGNYYLKKNCHNYINSYTFSGNYGWGPFDVLQTMLNDFSANGFQKFSLSNSPNRSKMFAWLANYTVPKAGIYYFVLSEHNSPQDSEYVSFPFRESDDFILGSTDDTTGIDTHAWGRYIYPLGAGNINGLTKSTVRSKFKTCDDSLLIIPVYIKDNLSGSIYMHTIDTIDTDKIINMIGLVDNFNFTKEYPVWD